MIQRVQSLWLLLAAVCAFLTLKLSFYSGALLNVPYHELNGTENFGLMALTIGLAVLAFINIFLFRNRGVQLRICVAAILVDIILVVLYLKAKAQFTQGTYNLWCAFHPIIIIALIFAIRGMNNDNRLIKDSDRLR